MKAARLDNANRVEATDVDIEVEKIVQAESAVTLGRSTAAFVVHGDIDEGLFKGGVYAPEKVSFESRRTLHCQAEVRSEKYVNHCARVYPTKKGQI